MIASFKRVIRRTDPGLAGSPRPPGRPALRRASYPQVEPRALALAHHALAFCRAEASVAEALRLLRRRTARLVVVETKGRAGVVRPEDLRRADALGLSSRSVGDVAWWGVPTLSGEASEISVRRLLRAGAPVALIKQGGALVAAVERAALSEARAPLSLAGRLARECAGETLELLRSVGGLAEGAGVRAYVAGGFVRDLLRSAPCQDLDFVVEGDALELARLLCRELRGTLVVHQAFGTASIEGSRGGRLDVAMARRERYAARGALPTVSPASIDDDLARRDFTVNAMALALTGSGFGQLLDPFGGLGDVANRRIRILHPLSFVEDPTRIFRAARYAIRLGFAIDRWTRRCLALALTAGPYPALSGQRLVAELELVLSEAGWKACLLSLGRLGAFRLLDPSYRFSRIAGLRLSDLGGLLHWGSRHGVVLNPLPLALLCLVGHLPASLAERCFRRLALSGEPHARLMEAHAEGAGIAQRLEGRARGPASRRAALMRGLSIETLGFAWLVGSPSTRQQIQWFLSTGRGVRPALSGEDLLALGVPRGPAVSLLLQRLRDQRLDGLVSSREDEVQRVREWSEARAEAPSRAGEED